MWGRKAFEFLEGEDSLAKGAAGTLSENAGLGVARKNSNLEVFRV